MVNIGMVTSVPPDEQITLRLIGQQGDLPEHVVRCR
jgi:hypothetical protein